MDSSNPKSQNRNTWNGLNILGKILTDTRIRFENENKPHNKMKI